MRPLRAVLVSLRDPDDPMVAHEVECFRSTAGLERLDTLLAATTRLGPEHIEQADLFFFGGSGAYSVLDDVDWVKRSLDFFCQVAEARVPAWASCFGFQGLALALGGTVINDNARQKLGSYPILKTADSAGDPLFDAVSPRFMAHLGHHDFVVELPKNVTLLAQGEDGSNQAFLVHDSQFWGSQFHPELDTDTTYARWLHYREHYEGDQRDEIDARIKNSPRTPEAKNLLRALVARASARAAQR